MKKSLPRSYLALGFPSVFDFLEKKLQSVDVKTKAGPMNKNRCLYKYWITVLYTWNIYDLVYQFYYKKRKRTDGIAGMWGHGTKNGTA